MNLQDFRAKNPAYDDMEDGALAKALHSRFYSDLPEEEFFSQIGYAAAPPAEAPQPARAVIEEGVQNATLGEKAATVGRVVTATGQALQNVPENLTVGAQGLRMAGAEATMDRQGSADIGLAEIPRRLEELRARYEEAKTSGDPTVFIPLQREIAGLVDQLTFLENRAREDVAGAQATLKDATTKIGEAKGNMVPVEAEYGTPEYYISAAIGSTAESAPALLASVLTRSPAPMMTFIGAYSGGRAYESGRAEGLTPAEARGYATLSAIAEGIPEALPVSVMLKPGADFLTRVAKGVAAESAQESVTEALQAGIDKGYIDEDMTWEEARTRIQDAAITGGIAGGVMGGGVDVVQRGLGAIAEAAPKAKTAAQTMADNVANRLGLPKQPQKPPKNAPSAAPAVSAGAGPMADVPQLTRNILDFIGSNEAPRGYDQIFSGSAVDTPKPLTSMTIAEVRAWQDASVRAGAESSAAGRFQIIRKTMDGLIAKLGLTGNELFDEAMQDRMAVELMREKGLDEFQAGKLSVAEFGNRLASVWAALPQVAGENAGRGVYDGDGLNSAYADPDAFISILSGGEFSAIPGQGGSGFGGEQTQAPQQVATETGGGSGLAAPETAPADTNANLPQETTAEGVTETPISEPAAPTAEDIAQAVIEAEAAQPDTKPVDVPKVESEAAAAVEQAAAETETAPTDGQKEAGNYKKGTVKLQGMDVAIENPRGSERSGVDPDGQAWSVTMPAHYGYVKGTKGADGDPVDVYVGDNPDAAQVFIVDQVELGTANFDEHKVMMGFDTLEQAQAAYERGFSDGKGKERMSAIRPVTVGAFREWLKSGAMSKPYSKQRPAVAPVGPSGDASFEGMVDMLRAANPDKTDAELAEPARQIIRKVGGRVSKNERPENPFNALDERQKIDAVALAQASGMPTQRSAPKKRSSQPKPAVKKMRVKKSEVELARKTAINKLKEAALEIEKKVRVGDDTLTEVTITTPTGAKTTFRFQATEAGVSAARRVLAEWKKKPSHILQLEAPSAMAQSLNFDSPMPQNQPLLRYLDVQRPADNQINVAGEVVQLPPAHKPVRREAIRSYLEGIMGTRVYQGKVRGKTRLGFYRKTNGEMRIKQYDDIEVMAHEVAHWMDFHTSFAGRWNRMRKAVSGTAKDQMKSLSYTSQPALVEVEGFAEFVRLWLTQYNAAQTIAPDFTKAFEAELATDPKFEKRMKRLRKEMHLYFNQGALAQARANIGEDETVATATRRFVQNRPVERFRQQAVDRLHGIKVAEREVSGTISNAEASAYKLMQMVNGAGSLFDTVIRDGTPKLGKNGDIERRGKGLDEVFAPIYKQGAQAFDDFLTYAAGRRASELKAQDRENLFSAPQIKAMLELERDGFAEVFEDFQTFNAELLDFYVEMGLITNDQRKAFAKNNQSYVPFQRVAEVLETGKSKGAGASKLGARLQGGDSNVNDIADNIVDGIMTNVRQAMIARAKVQLYRTLSSSDTGGQFAVKIGPDSKKVQMHADEMATKVAQAMAQLGFGVSNDGMIVANPTSKTMTDVSEIAAVLKKNPETLQFWQHNLPPTTESTFVDSVIIGGRLQYFEVQDPVLVESLLGQEMLELGALYDAGHAVKNMMTRLITSMPPFLIPNIVRDTVSAGTMSDSGFVPVADSVRGLAHIVTKSPTYRQWQRNGGGYSSLVQATTQRKGKGSATLNRPADWRNPMTALTKALAAWDGVASLFENATRVGEFRKAMLKGTTATEAAYRSREISTDFAKRPGNVGWTALLRLTAFMNAALQGNDRLVKAFVGEDGRIDRKRLAKVGTTAATRLFMRFGSVMAAFTALLWYLQNDDERYKELTPDQKSRFWHIFLPGEYGSIQIPKPYGMGFIFADVVENALDHVAKVDGARPAKNLAWAAAHHFWFLDYPSIIQPGVEAMKNETFTGAPVVPVYMQDLSPENQFRSTTPEIYKRLGEAAGMSPMRLQHYTRGFLGYLETAMSDGTEALLWDRDAFGERPFPRGVDDYFFKQFKGAPFPYRTKYTEQYYDLRQRARTAAADLRQLSKGRTPDRLEAFAGDKLSTTLAGLNRDLAKVDRGLAAMRDGIDAIKYNPAMSRETKEREIEKMYRAKNSLLKTVYANVNDIVTTIEKETK